jgi:hypothetical protein
MLLGVYIHIVAKSARDSGRTHDATRESVMF